MSEGSTNPGLVYFTVPMPPELLAELRNAAEDCGREVDEYASLLLGLHLSNRRQTLAKRAAEDVLRDYPEDLGQWRGKRGG